MSSCTDASSNCSSVSLICRVSLPRPPSYALNIAEVAEREGVDLRKSKLEVALCGAEPWSEAMRREIQVRLGVHAYDNYGLSEIMGPGVAVVV